MSTSLTNRRRSYVTVVLTLTTADHVYHILDLINTIIAAESSMSTPPMVAPDACGHLILQAPGGNTDTTHGVLIGDGLISTTRYGYELKKGDEQSYHAPMNTVQLGSMYAMAGADGDKLSVEVMSW